MQAGREFVAIWRHEKRNPTSHVFTADTWVQGIQILPDNPRVLHHCNLAFGSFGGGLKEENFITGNVPGGEPMALTLRAPLTKLALVLASGGLAACQAASGSTPHRQPASVESVPPPQTMRRWLVLETPESAPGSDTPARSSSQDPRDHPCLESISLRRPVTTRRLAIGKSEFHRDHCRALDAVTSLLEKRWNQGDPLRAIPERTVLG